MALIVCLLLSGCKYKKKTTDYDTYLKYVDKAYTLISTGHAQVIKDIMPTQQTLGKYTDLYSTFRHEGVIYPISTVALFLDYDKSEYEKQVNYINENYLFIDSTYPECTDIYASINGYEIKIVDKGLYTYDIYHNWAGHDYLVSFGMMIGTNTAENKICYLYFCDPELDIIDNLDEYIKEYFYLP